MPPTATMGPAMNIPPPLALFSKRAVARMLAGALLLPIVIVVLVATGALLGALGDAAGERWLSRLALAAGIGWVLDLVLLVVALGLNSLDLNEEPTENSE